MAGVLVVDDSADTVAMLAFYLKGQGHQVSAAYGGEEALRLAAAEPPDLVLLDVNMPGMNGLEVCRRLKAEPRCERIPVILLTCLDDERHIVDGLDAGADDYVTKPFNHSVLAARIRSALRVKTAHDELSRACHALEESLAQQRRADEQIRLKDEQLRQAQKLRTLAIRDAHEETIHRLLTATLYRDEETGAHIKRTGLCSELLARAAGWSAPEAELLRMAAPMHDVGKIGIPDAILRKPQQLTPQELDVMRGHTLIGAEILRGSKSPVLRMAHDIALCHHEQWDGTGYPRGLVGQTIPESARVVAIVDVFDAMTHDRVYRPALSLDDVERELEMSIGSQFDPSLAAVFLTLLPEIDRIMEEHPDEPRQPVSCCLPAAQLLEEAGVP